MDFPDLLSCKLTKSPKVFYLYNFRIFKRNPACIIRFHHKKIAKGFICKNPSVLHVCLLGFFFFFFISNPELIQITLCAIVMTKLHV